MFDLVVIGEKHFNQIRLTASFSVQALWWFPAKQCWQKHQMSSWIFPKWTIRILPAAKRTTCVNERRLQIKFNNLMCRNTERHLLWPITNFNMNKMAVFSCSFQSFLDYRFGLDTIWTPAENYSQSIYWTFFPSI